MIESLLARAEVEQMSAQVPPNAWRPVALGQASSWGSSGFGSGARAARSQQVVYPWLLVRHWALGLRGEGRSWRRLRSRCETLYRPFD